MSVPRLTAALAALAVLSACSDSPVDPLDSGPAFATMGANPVVGSASGSGQAPCGPDPDPDPVPEARCFLDGELRTFSFNALRYADGSVSGRAQTNNRDNGNIIKADVDVCVRFFGADKNRAWMIGTVTHTNREGFPVGAKIGFAVADNGEGNEAQPDQITGFGLAPPFVIFLICQFLPDEELDGAFDGQFGFDIVSGNVQVRAPDTD